MLKRDELGLPSFWALQALGWIGFYVLVLLTVVLPYNRPEEFRNQTICCGSLFLASLCLRPLSRSLLGRSLPWLALEARAFVLAAGVGAVATFVAEFATLRATRMVWANFLDTWLQFSVVLFLWCTLYFSIKQWQQATRERERLLWAESEAREARLSALRYQLNPHFLFNSLNAASTLVLEGDASAATRMLSQIGELLRITLNNEILPEKPLSQELAFIEQYLAIEQTRLGQRLRVNMIISQDTLDAVIPGMLLQPLVENAVRHGVAPQIEGGTIRIESRIHANHLVIGIGNSGPRHEGLAMRTRPPGKGIGLTNTEERLKTLYGEDYRFSLAWPEAGGCEATIEIPLRKAGVEALVCAH